MIFNDLEYLMLASACFDSLEFDYNYFFADEFFFWFDWYTVCEKAFWHFSRNSETVDFYKFLQINYDFSYNNFLNLENLTSIYHYSIPTVKLYYPEPFIASASFMHFDLWFVHILVYQYWLWFVFIFIIIFFFITFVCTVRWCNLRTRPRRETRGVSRSKCGDLITACVPVSWATSIIISESTDAIDYYDGFGTTELVIGIRAYQWGWEYYYPKDLDLNYNIKNTYSSFIGRSLKYNYSSDINQKKNNLWKFYQNKNTDHVITPAHVLFFSLDNFKIFNYLNFNDIGSNVLNESNVFRKIKNFSKFNFSFYNSSFFTFKQAYLNLSSFYIKNDSFSSSSVFGTRRQHDFLINQNSFNNFSFNPLSIKKLFSYNYSFNKNLTQVSPFFLFFFQNLVFDKNFLNFKNSFFFNKNFLFFNSNTDKKPILNIFLKKTLFFKKNIFNNKLFFETQNLWAYNTFSNKNFFNNVTFFNRNFDNFSPNQTILTNSKYSKKFINFPFLKSHINFNNYSNLLEENLFFFNKINNNFMSFYNNFKLKNVNHFLLNKITSNKIYLDSPHAPVTSNNFYFNSLNYDNLRNTIIPTPLSFQSKEDLFPSYLFSIYWNSLWMHSSFSLKLKNFDTFSKYSTFFYFPLFNLNYDYDFKNWQTWELLEDSFWDSFLNVYIFDENKNLFSFYYSSTNNKTLLNFFNFNKNFFFNNKNFFFNNEFFFNFFNEDFHNNTKFLNLNSYQIYPIINNYNYVEESYDNFKNFSFLFNFYNKTLLPFNSFYYNSVSAFEVFNMFRSTYQDFSWLNSWNNLSSQFYLNNYFNSTRSNYLYNIRNTTKNSLVNYNALQKVFKTRLDENRSNSKLQDFNLMFINSSTQPFINSFRPTYEKIIGKNHNYYFKLNFYKTNFINNFSSLWIFNNSLNFYFFDFPFLLSYKSDPSRYLWIDWFAKWGFYEVQPSSSSKYTLVGMPYFNKFFEFNYEQNESLNETETYFIRINKARKNNPVSWNYAPFFFLKSLNWYPLNYFYNFQNSNKIINVFFQLDNISWYWNKNNVQLSLNFSSSNSNISSFARSSSIFYSNISFYLNTFSNIQDYLNKKEYLYKQFFFSKNFILNLPSSLIASPNNLLLKEIKSLFDYSDPLILNNEYSKHVLLNSLETFNQQFLNSFFNFYKTTNINWWYLNFLNYFSNNTSKNNYILLKNTHRPLKKGISNMIRLHGTGAIALPIEIRLQVLASSKDVIHSWAIPSAGIKIDCVPGYSSHKVMIFLVSGIFWGQCMEICGRYHHWMPIIVYFMKRDLFFLWCTHFVFLSGSNSPWNINERQFTDYYKIVSHDKNSWLSEIKN